MAADVMTPNPATVELGTRVSDALERMGALGVGRLPVVDSDDPRCLIGVFRREDVIAAYHQALMSARLGVPGDGATRSVGGTVLDAGDATTALGGREGNHRLLERLTVGLEAPDT